jgi:hypothetical protein
VTALLRRLIAAALLRAAARQAARVLRPDPTPRGPLIGLAVSAALIIVTAALGPSAAEQNWPGAPPFAAHLHPSAGLVTALLAAAIITGTYGLLGCLNALKHAWTPEPRRLLAASALVVAVLALMPPIGSADPGSYVAYGRLAATDHDPYATAPAVLPGNYGAAVEDPWRSAPSIYGPIATGEQRLAVSIAGGGAHGPAHAVFLLGLLNALAFLAAGLLLYRLAGTVPARRRAALVFSANPLVLLVGVAGAHIDVLVAFLAIASVAALGPRSTRIGGAFVAGLLGGAAVAVKASAALVAVALAWRVGSRRGRPRRPFGARPAFIVGAAAVLVPAYLLAGQHAFDQLRHASGFVSFADPWRLVTHPLESLLGHSAARDVVRVAAWIGFVVMALLLRRGLPGRRLVGASGEVRGEHEAVARSALVLVLAWLLTAPYVLPWYALTAWVLVAALPASGYDRVLTSWTATLALAYLPGRQVPLPRWLHDGLTIWKSGVAPVVLLGVAFVAAALSLRRRT